MTELTILIAAGSLGLNVLVVVVTGVAVVSRIEKTTAVLGTEMKHLASAIDKLAKAQVVVEHRVREAEDAQLLMQEELRRLRSSFGE